MAKCCMAVLLAVLVSLCGCSAEPVMPTEPAPVQSNTEAVTVAPEPSDLPLESLIPEQPTCDPNPDSFDIPGFVPMERVSLGDLGREMTVEAVGQYSGPFYEDGSDDEVENVLALIVRNGSEKPVEYCRLELGVNGEPCEFRISGLPGKSCCLVLASDRRYVRADTALSIPTITDYAAALDAVFDYAADFELYTADGVLNIKNISDRQIPGEIYLCYKNFDYNVYLGGICYRAAFGTTDPGAISQCLQEHFSRDRSAVLYMSYVRS